MSWLAFRAKVRKDNFGLYVKSGGYITRPRTLTHFVEGDTVKTHHHGGSPTHTVQTATVKEYWESRSVDSLDYDYAQKMFADKYGTEGPKHFDEYVLLSETWRNRGHADPDSQRLRAINEELKEYIRVNYYERLNEKRLTRSLASGNITT